MIKIINNLFKYQKIRFLFVGGLNTLVGYGSFAVLLFFNVNYLIANTISYIIGVIHSYFWNKKFTFKSNNKSPKELVRFIFVYIINYLAGMFILYVLVDIIGINQYISGILNLITTTIISWFGHEYFSFKRS